MVRPLCLSVSVKMSSFSCMIGCSMCCRLCLCAWFKPRMKDNLCASLAQNMLVTEEGFSTFLRNFSFSLNSFPVWSNFDFGDYLAVTDHVEGGEGIRGLSSGSACRGERRTAEKGCNCPPNKHAHTHKHTHIHSQDCTHSQRVFRHPMRDLYILSHSFPKAHSRTQLKMLTRPHSA